MFESFFYNKKVNQEKLNRFGFVFHDGRYSYSTLLLDNQFRLEIIITEQEKIDTRLIDLETNEDYILYKIENTTSSFIVKIRQEIQKVLQEISNFCFETSVFKSELSTRIIQYINEKYGDTLAFLWERFPNNAVWRRKDNKKWYGALLTIPKSKLGFKNDNLIEILDLRAHPEDIIRLVDKQRYFPGYHMNKKNWITICLDNSLPFEEICFRIDESYRLAGRK